MCKARPGMRCTPHAAEKLSKQKDALRAASIKARESNEQLVKKEQEVRILGKQYDAVANQNVLTYAAGSFPKDDQQEEIARQLHKAQGKAASLRRQNVENRRRLLDENRRFQMLKEDYDETPGALKEFRDKGTGMSKEEYKRAFIRSCIRSDYSKVKNDPDTVILEDDNHLEATHEHMVGSEKVVDTYTFSKDVPRGTNWAPSQTTKVGDVQVRFAGDGSVGIVGDKGSGLREDFAIPQTDNDGKVSYWFNPESVARIKKSPALTDLFISHGIEI